MPRILLSVVLSSTFAAAAFGACTLPSTATLPQAIVGVPFSWTQTCAGGAGSYSYYQINPNPTWAPGLGTSNYNGTSTVLVSGTPTGTGAYSWQIYGTGDFVTYTNYMTVTLTILPAVSFSTGATLTAGEQGVLYPGATVTATGGSGAPYTYAVTAGALPTGLSMSSSGGITGTPTAAGSYSFTVRATDSGSHTASQTFSISICAPVSIANGAPPNGNLGSSYSFTASDSGGIAPYSWSITSGTIPTGLSLNTGTGAITGTPSAAGTFTFTYRTCDSGNATCASASYTVIIWGPPNIGLDTPQSNYAIYGTAYSVSGWAENSQNVLINRVEVHLDGANIANAIYGAARADICAIGQYSTSPNCPNVGYTYSLDTTKYSTGSHTLSVVAYDNNGQSNYVSVPITIAAGLGVTTASLASGLATSPYSQTLTAAGGTPAYSWSISSGSLPPGLSLSNGAVSGTPTTPGTYTFSVQVTDSATPTPQTAIKALTITIGAGLSIATTSLPSGLATSPYSQSLTAIGGTPSYTWTLYSGSLPAGLALGSSGAISGTPTSAGTSAFTVKITDSTTPTPQTATQLLSITIGAALSVTSSSLPNGLVNSAYSQTLTATGGTPGYVWTVVSGALPAGLSLSGTGAITGTPNAAGTFNFTTQATDSTSPTHQTASAALNITIAPALSITTASLPNGLATTAYSQNLGATGGTPSYIWTVTTGALPTGLSLAANGAISGTPTGAGTSAFTVQVTDSTGPLSQTASRSLSITIGAALSITSTTLPNGLVNSPYAAQSLAATGGTSPYTWSVASGNIPTGLTLSSSGVIGGTPTAAGDFTFTVQASDSTTPTAQLATKSLTITVIAPLGILTVSLPSAIVSSSYSQALTATGGTAPYSWAVAAGVLPPGLSISGSNITGVPTTAGSYAFTLKATDSSTPTAQIATQALLINIAASLAITTGNVPGAIAASLYSQSLTASGGTSPFAWTVSAGTLPTGLTLSSAGTISGTPTVPGSYAFSVQATDSTSPTAQTATQPLFITVIPALSIATASLPSAIANSPYSQMIAALGGTTPYTWSVSTGALPPGLALSNGTIAGTPSTVGTYSFGIKVTDATSPTAQSATQALTITITPPLSITTTSLSNALATTAYTASLAAAGGTAPYIWSLASGALPAGLSLSNTGVISGAPTAPGTFNFTVKATDSTAPTAQTATQALTLTVGPALSITTTSLPNGLATSPYVQSLAATGGTFPYGWTFGTGVLPPGLSLATSGTISGTPTTPGVYNFSVKATDSTSPTAQSAIQALQINIGASVSVTTSSLPSAVATSVYSQTLTASGGTAPYSWSIVSGALPAGLSLAPSGTISGAPTSTGSTNFTVKVIDSTSPTAQAATQALSITVTPALTITTATLPNGLATSVYAPSLSASGGTSPYTWTIAGGSLPAGLALAANGAITGTPTTAGVATFTVRAADSTTPTAQTATQSLTITIAPSLAITTASLANGLVSSPYSQILAATGGTSPYTWSLATGTLPGGLSLGATGLISGTPTSAGTFALTVQATDSTSPTHQFATQTLSLTIGAALSITTSSLPNATATVAYSQSLTATGGTPDYTWSLASGTLPTGLTLAPNGTLSGTATVPGSYSFVLQVSDATTPSPETATKAYSITVAAALSIATTALPNGLATAAYLQTLSTLGGTSPFIWTLASGTLPAGVSLSSAGLISGTPTTPSVSTFTVEVTDSTTPVAQTAQKTLSITVTNALSITTNSLPAALAGSPYSANLNAIGGTPSYTWTLQSGSLPPGLTLLTTGNIGGTPSAPGTFTFAVEATDSTNPIAQTATQSLSITVGAALSITTISPLPGGLVTTPYSATLVATGGTPPYSWTLAAGSPPAGLAFSSAGVLSGTPTAATSTTFSVQATDSTSPSPQSIIKAVSITIGAALSIATTTLPNGIQSSPYSQAISATGGTTPYSWTVSNGALPTGLTVSGGLISGTPTAPGIYTFTLRATDSTTPAAQTAIQSYTVTITGALAIATSALAPGAVGAAYIQTLAADGGTSPYSWALASGTLPTGVTLTPAGNMTGTPTSTGTYNITVQATDSTTPVHQTATRTLTLIINPALSITTATLATAVQGQTYTASLTGIGGVTPYIWTVMTGSLPAGLTLDANSGTVTGTPTASGLFSFTIKLTDSTANYASRSYNLTVIAPLTITSSALANGIVGTAYIQTLAATGGVTPYAWTLASGSVPPGLSLSTDGRITGTPTAAGTASFTVQVTDAGVPSQTTTKALTINILNPLVLTTASLANAIQGQAYSATLLASGGLIPYTWSLSGSLPAGLSLDGNAGIISGVATVSGAFPITIKVTDSNSSYQSRTLTLTVIAPLSITSASLPSAITSTAYSQTLVAAGGTSPYTWTVSSGSLPAGLVLGSTTGTISGTPTATGSATFTVQVADAGTPSQTATKTLTIAVLSPLTVTTAALANAVQNQAYSATLAATGGLTPYSWSLIGSLPVGLSLDPNAGTIFGTPTTSGAFPITIKVTDANSSTQSKGVTLTVLAPLAVTTSSLPGGTTSVAYSQTLSAAGGAAPYTWALASGALPAGLSLSSTGAITGTPTTPGSSAFTVQVADSGTPSQTATKTLNVNILNPLVLTAATVPNAIQGQPYSATLAANGGLIPYTWTYTGSLPNGLSLDANAGVISGISTVSGPFPITIKVTDSNADYQTKTLTLTVIPPVTVLTASLPNGITNAAYSQTLAASGGVTPYTWTLVSGSLPSGLSLATNGVITGTPTVSGSASFAVQVADSGAPGQTASRSLTLNVADPLAISTAALPNGAQGQTYTTTLAGSGGFPPYTWSVSAGSLPTSLSLNASTGDLTGTPTSAGTFTFTIKLIDSNSANVTHPFTVTVATPLSITTTTLPGGITGTAYSQSLSATGGAASYTWTVTAGSLPTGISISTDGKLTGTPSVAGSFSFTIQATDSGAPQQTKSQPFNIVVLDPLAITTGSLPNSIQGQTYSAAVSAAGGTKPYTWTLTTGTLPAGITFDGNTATLSGSPTSAGSFPFTLKVTDANSTSLTKNYTLTVIPPLAITTSSLPLGNVGIAYSQPLAASGGVTPYTWTVSTGSLPAGLNLSSAGKITGTPSAPASSNFTVQVSDSGTPSQAQTQAVSITVTNPLAIGTPSLPDAIRGTAYMQTLAGTGGATPYHWSLKSGTLPTGLTLDVNSGTITGIPTAAGAGAFTLQLADSSSPAQTVTKDLTLAVRDPLAILTTMLPHAHERQTYSFVLTAEGGATPYQWSISSGSLPNGVTLDASSGTISGITSAIGSSTFSVKLTDATSPIAQSVSQNLTLTVDQDFSITTTGALAPGIENVAYSATLSASDGATPYTWTLASGAPPPGIALSNDGIITGTPTTSGHYAFTVNATETPTARSATATLGLLIQPQLTLRTTALPDCILGATYSQQLATTGGIGPFTWTVASGTLPPGLILDAAGNVTGIPITAGKYTFTVGLTDSSIPNQTISRNFTINVALTMALGTASLPNAFVGAAYSQTLNVTGGVAPYNWTISAGSLPTGLTLAPNGAVTGTPTTLGTASFSVSVTDSASNNATATLSIAVLPTLSITTPTLPSGALGSAYSQAIAATGGTKPYIWTLLSGALPQGLTLDTNGNVSGNALTPGTSTFTVSVADATDPAQRDSRQFTITVALGIAITTANLPDGYIGAFYTRPLSAVGGTPPYSWLINSGSLPTGLSLSSDGTVAGTPTAAGTATFAATVSDSTAPTPHSATASLTMTVRSPLAITTAALPDSSIGANYAQPLTAVGGTMPYTWGLAAGTLPTGLTVDAAGNITGNPRSTGTFRFTLQVTDLSSPRQTATHDFTIQVALSLSVSTTGIPDGFVGRTYFQALSAIGGLQPYTWTLSAGALPAGLALSPDGTITGVPTALGPSQFTIQVQDASAPTPRTATLALSVNIRPPLAIVTTTLPDSQIGVRYAHALAATGGTTPYSWSLAAGNLPPGLTLSPDGNISGAATAAGSYTFTLQSADASVLPQSATRTFTIAISLPLAITTTTLPDAFVQAAYSQVLVATGGSTPYAWTILSGALPPGLTLTADGKIAGTPTASGIATFTAQVTDTASRTANAVFTISVRQALSITTTSLPDAPISARYTQSLTAVGGTTPYTWTISSGALPLGLTFTPDGNITGAATTPGNYSFTVRVTDSSLPPLSASQGYAITAALPLTIQTARLPDGFLSTPYAQAVSATGGVAPYSWTVASGSLPTGLTLTPDGKLTGTPTATGTSTFTLLVADSSSTPRSASAVLSLTIRNRLAIATTTLPDTAVGANYFQSLTATGGTAPHTWTILNGTLPPGLALSPEGNLSGSPSTGGAFTFTVAVADASSPQQTASLSFAVTVDVTIAITTPTLPSALISVAYSQDLAAVGGIAPYTWMVSAGSLPPGLALSPMGNISGVPSGLGSATFTVQASDSANPAHTATRAYTIQVATPLAIATAALPDASAGVAYTAAFAALNGTAPYHWTVSSGSLPPGLTLDSSGNLSGTPTAVGAATFTVQVADSGQPQQRTTRAFTINVLAGFTITTISIPAASPGVPYVATFAATGGTTPYAWTIATGTLPPGLVLSTAGTLTGTPSTNGAYTFTLQATDAKNSVATRPFSIAVGAVLTVATTTLQDATLGAAYRQSLAANGGASPYLWNLSAGQLPTGLILLASGDIIGQPMQAMTTTFTVTVNDSALPPASAARTLTLTVQPGFAITTASLPHGSPSVPYLAVLTAINGTQPYTWSIALGSLPPGLRFSTAGAIAGTVKPGTYPLLIQATDSSNPALTTTRQLVLVVDTALSITTSALSNGVVGYAYDLPLTATNGASPYTWSADVLPPGLALLPSGEFYGIPLAAGAYRITFTVADSSEPNATATRTLTLLITRDLTIVTDTLPPAAVGKAYSTAVTAIGGNPPYVFSGSGLPSGLALDQSGVISGMPIQAGSYNVIITVSDQTNTSMRAQFTLTAGTTLAVATSALPAGTTGAPYYAFLTATGGTPPYNWSVDNVPAGLRLIPSIGLVVGTPTAAGAFNFTATVTDSAPTPASASPSLTLSIGAPLAIATYGLPTGQSGQPYTATLAATGGAAPYSWTGDLTTFPAGLALDTNGTLRGPVTDVPGAFSLSICVMDSASPPAHACGVRTIVVGPAFEIDPLTLKPTARGQSLTYHFTTNGAKGAPVFAAVLPLPSGLVLSTDGILSGSPTTSGVYTLSIFATDAANETAARDFSLTVLPPLAATTTTLPRAILGGRYAASLSAASGSAPYTWALTSGPLPVGITLDPAGFLFGSPTAPGSFALTFSVIDASSTRAAVSLTLTVAPVLSIATTALPDGLVKSPYSATLAAASGSDPYTWAVAAGKLPDGLTLSSDGAITGTPIRSGLYTFVVTLADSAGQVAGAGLSLNVSDTLSVPSSSIALSDGAVGTAYSGQLVTNSASGVTWSLVLGDLPPGLALTPAGAIAGVPTAAGTFQFVARAIAGSQQTDQLYSLRVSPAPIASAPAPVLAADPLATAYVGRPYAATIAASGGAVPYAWTIVDGNIPDGLTFTSGVITGTPTTAGLFRFIVAVSDAANQRTSSIYTLLVRQGLATDGAIALDQAINAIAKIPLNASGGVPPYTWTISTGTLPPGLAITGSAITGTPTTAGSFTATLSVHDADQPQQTGVLTVLIHVNASLAVTTTTLPTVYPQIPYIVAFTSSGGSAPYRWSLASGQLPAGLSFTADGILQGTTTAHGSYPIAVTVTDATSQRATANFTLTIASLAITTTFLPPGAPQVRYSAVLDVTGGAAPYHWSITKGALPTGLTLTSSGLVSGTPTQVANVMLTFQVSDANGGTASTDLHLVIALPKLGSLHLGPIPDPATPASQVPLSLTIDTAAPIDLGGTLTLQLHPTTPGHNDDSAMLLAADGTTSRNVPFLIPTGSKSAEFNAGALRLATGTLAGSITVTASVPIPGQDPLTTTTTTHLTPCAPVITSAKVAGRDKYSLEIQIAGYSTTAEVHFANFAFSGTGTVPPPQTIGVQALFDSWYLSPTGSQKGGVFTYTQKFDFTGPADGLGGVVITLTNSVAPSTPFKLTF